MLEAGYPAAAADIFRKTIALQPAASYYNLGIAFKDLSRAQDSVTSYIAALEHTGPHNFEACHFNLGRAFQMLADSATRAGYHILLQIFLREVRLNIEALNARPPRPFAFASHE